MITRPVKSKIFLRILEIFHWLIIQQSVLEAQIERNIQPAEKLDRGIEMQLGDRPVMSTSKTLLHETKTCNYQHYDPLRIETK